MYHNFIRAIERFGFIAFASVVIMILNCRVSFVAKEKHRYTAS